MVATDAHEAQLWERRANEPVLWYERFVAYRDLGVSRSLDKAYRVIAAAQGLNGERAGQAWRAAAVDYAWQERATAWDDWVRSEAERIEGGRRFEASQKRRGIIDSLLGAVVNTFVIADLPAMTMVQAREALPTLRMLLRDLLAADRLEAGEVTWVTEEALQKAEAGSATVGISADQVVQALAELERWPGPGVTPVTGGARAEPDADGPNASETTKPVKMNATKKDKTVSREQKPRLLVVVGSDPELGVDVAMLRGVKRETGLDFHVLKNASRADLDAYLRRERSNGRPVTLMHVAVHAGHAGIQLDDGLADGDWLSARLLGVSVLLLGACNGDRVGDWLKVVEHVITVDDEIAHGDAALLTQHFWRNYASGMDVDAALTAALERCPPVVSESVVRHW